MGRRRHCQFKLALLLLISPAWSYVQVAAQNYSLLDKEYKKLFSLKTDMHQVDPRLNLAGMQGRDFSLNVDFVVLKDIVPVSSIQAITTLTYKDAKGETKKTFLKEEKISIGSACTGGAVQTSLASLEVQGSDFNHLVNQGLIQKNNERYSLESFQLGSCKILDDGRYSFEITFPYWHRDTFKRGSTNIIFDPLGKVKPELAADGFFDSLNFKLAYSKTSTGNVPRGFASYEVESTPALDPRSLVTGAPEDVLIKTSAHSANKNLNQHLN